MPGNWLDILRHVVDATLVSLIAYKIFTYLRGTRAVQLIKGIFVIGLLAALAWGFNLTIMKWVLQQLQVMAVVAVVVVFQPELRSMLERLGRDSPFGRRLLHGQEHVRLVISEIVRAVREMSEKRIGALIAVERATGLKEYVETGTQLDALLSYPLLLQIFEPKTPLHDGAVIVRHNRILAAGCYLPLSSNKYLSKELGTRHRAAVGLSELSDALVIVVSEETGAVSVAEEGKLLRYLDPPGLEQLLESRLMAGSGTNRGAQEKERDQSKSLGA